MADKIITVATLRGWLDLSESQYDTQLATIIEGLTTQFEEVAQRHIVADTRTDIYDGSGTHNLYLHEPAKAITSVHQDADQDWTSSNLISSSDYLLLPNAGHNRMRLHYTDNIWIPLQANVRVVYEVGFDTIPSDLTRAARTQAAFEWNRLDASRKGLDTLEDINLDEWEQTFREVRGLLPEVRDVVEEYIPRRL